MRILTLIAAGALLSCSTAVNRPIAPEEPVAEQYQTFLTASLRDFGDLLRSYPMRLPYRLNEEIFIEIYPIANHSGEPSIPSDLSQMATSIIGNVGFPIVPKSPLTLPERQVRALEWQTTPGELLHDPGPEAHVIVRGAVMEAEKWWSSENALEIDALFRNGDLGRDSIDAGASGERGREVWTLGLDLSLGDTDGHFETASFRTDIVRYGRSSSFGVFYKGSGVGLRSRALLTPSKSKALRVATQMSVLTLLGRYFRVPYWRVLPEGLPDDKLIREYRELLASGEAPYDYRWLLFAHGVEINLNSATFSVPEQRAVEALRRRLGRPEGESDLDLAMYLWETVPFGPDSRINNLRRLLRRENAAQESATILDHISGLQPGYEMALQPLHFKTNSYALDEDVRAYLDYFATSLQRSSLINKPWWIEIRGHCDERGERLLNQRLSRQRADEVRDYLENTHPITRGKVQSQGLGFSEPIMKDAASEYEHQLNRRVEVLLVAGELASTNTSIDRGVSKNRAAQAVALFPEEQWPLPRGVVLPSKLSRATLATVVGVYPDGKRVEEFDYYAIDFGPDDSELFHGVTFFFRRDGQNTVSSVGFKCRHGAEERLRASLAEKYPKVGSVSPSAPVRLLNADGYGVYFELSSYCLRIDASV